MEYCTIFYFFFLLFVLLIKSGTAHIDVQTKPPVLIPRCPHPVHINMIPCTSSQHRPIRWVTALGWKGGSGGGGADGSRGFVGGDFNET